MGNSEQLRYKYLAYIVIRDALGFYFGIPQFLNNEHLTKVFDKAVAEKIRETKKEKSRDLTDKEIANCSRLIRRSLAARVKELKEDWIHSKEVLFEDNLWLEWLGLDKDFFIYYIGSLNTEAKDALAVVPKWKTRDHSLGRMYINDNFTFTGF